MSRLVDWSSAVRFASIVSVPNFTDSHLFDARKTQALPYRPAQTLIVSFSIKLRFDVFEAV